MKRIDSDYDWLTEQSGEGAPETALAIFRLARDGLAGIDPLLSSPHFFSPPFHSLLSLSALCQRRFLVWEFRALAISL